MRVLILDHTYPLADVQAILPDAEFATMDEAGPGVEALLVSPDAPVRAADFDRLPDLKVIATASTGTDHIDLEAAAARGVVVHNVAGYCTEEVADHTLALGLNLVRRLEPLAEQAHSGDWLRINKGTIRSGSDLSWGVIGFGRIGRAVAA